MHHIGVYPFRRHFNLSVCVSDEAAYRAIGVSYRKVNATASKSIPSLVASSSLNPSSATSSVKVSFDAKAAGSNSFTSFLGAGCGHDTWCRCTRPASSCHANDPHEEHDFGSFKAEGRTIFFKIDYYDKSLTYHSPDPSAPSVTERVITIMLAEEY